MKKDVFRTVITVALIMVGFVFMILLSAGIRLEFNKLAEPQYWLDVFVKLTVTLVLYNAIFALDLQSRKNNKNSRHYVSVVTKQLKVNRIKNENLFGRLRTAVEAENDERYRQECNRRIHKICVRVDFNDLPKEKVVIEDWLNEMREIYLLNDKDLKNLKKVALKILNGKVQIDKLTADDILDMLGEDDAKNAAIKFSASKVMRYQNLLKTGMFLLSVTFMTVFRYSPSWTDIIFDIIINSFLLVGATFSAINNSIFFLKRKTTVFENQNNFLVERMELKDEYVAKKEGA